MVDRTYTGFDLPDAQPLAPRPARPMGAQQERVDNTPSLGAAALGAILEVGVGLAKQNFDQSVQEHYLRGSRAVAAKQAVEEVDADAFMAPFVRGGFNEATWRSEQAKFSQEM